MSKFSTPKNIIKYYEMGKIGVAYFQFVNDQCAKFEYIWITIGVTEYTNQKPLSISCGKISKFNTPQKCNNIYQMCTEREMRILQCVEKHYAAFEYKGMKKTVGVTDYTNQTPAKHLSRNKMS